MITFRRYHLDRLLNQEEFHGDVLDVGGKKENKRGSFELPLSSVNSWKYVNTDPSTKPDFCASADSLPLPNNSVDIVLLTEVIEHVVNPERVLQECFRVLRPDGKLIASIPFLYGVHGDPSDYQRWTSERISLEFQRAGFLKIIIIPMGGLISVVADLYEMYCFMQYTEQGSLSILNKIFRKFIRSVCLQYLLRKDEYLPYKNVITTGYWIRAQKCTATSALV